MHSKLKFLLGPLILVLIVLWLFPFLNFLNHSINEINYQSLEIHQTNGRFQLLPEYDVLRDQLADWLLENSKKVLEQKTFKGISKPNLKGLQLYLVRKGNVIDQYNMNSLSEADSDWQKQFFLGIRSKQEIFETKSKFFFDRPWSWDEFDRLRKSLNVAKKDGAFKLWSMQGDRNLFLFLIYDLSQISEIKNESKFSSNKIDAFNYVLSFPVRLTLSIACCLLIIICLIYPLTVFHLCRYDIILGLILFSILILMRDGISYLMNDWFNSREEIAIKQKRNEMSTKMLNLLQDFTEKTNAYGRKTGKLFQKNVNWDLLSRNDIAHLKIVAKSDLYTNLLLVSNIGIWELSNKFSVNSKELIDVFAMKFIEKLLDRELKPKELLILANRAGIMDIWVGEKNRNNFLRSSLAYANDAEFRITSVSESDIGLFWTGIVTPDKTYAAYLVLHNNTMEMLKVFLDQIEDSLKSEFTYVVSDRWNRLLHLWGVDSPEIENRYRMQQVHRLTNESSDWIKVELNHHAFGKKMISVYTKKSLILADLNNQKLKFYKILDLASSIAFLFLLLLLFRFKIQIAKVLNGLKQATNSDFNFNLREFGWDETSQVINSFNLISKKLHQNQQLSPFVAKEILDLFRAQDGQLQRELCDDAVVMFSDIRSFTTLSEQQSPEEVVRMLNQYFEIWSETVNRYGGVIERFIGDAIQVVFFRTRVKNTQQSAIECAIKTREKIMEWNIERHQRGEFVVKNGIGLASGNIRFTILGNSVKRHFVSQGEAVVRAEELEAISAYGKSSCIVSDRETMQLLDEQYDFIRWMHEDQLIFELKEE